MCGIVGYVGNGNTADVLLESLVRLEYRGYDSAGVAMVCDGSLQVIKSYGRIFNLKEKMPRKLIATAGIGHTRWATHGKPSEINAHPHKDCTGKIAVVHNGIIENYRELKDMLDRSRPQVPIGNGHRSIEPFNRGELYRRYFRAVPATIKQLKGSFAMARH